MSVACRPVGTRQELPQCSLSSLPEARTDGQCPMIVACRPVGPLRDCEFSLHVGRWACCCCTLALSSNWECLLHVGRWALCCWLWTGPNCRKSSLAMSCVLRSNIVFRRCSQFSQRSSHSRSVVRPCLCIIIVVSGRAHQWLHCLIML